MQKLLFASFESEDALKAVKHELTTATIAGFPREKILANEEKKEIRVITTAATEAEVRKILKEHHPREFREEEWKG
ncbi:hypothetical protein [Wenzhouxiangella sp. XN24]|uniref:hypothetical protein n=1 Tax=Wenzhouxiangella sp. XN24 TaxID=2713569 RepID=UPI0013EA2662|nr:hypothetical protein [Wenzhouxiangella sp. XN24]NGX17678.1 hypothetical protein [Wenzhouxiangella sp. XN24]